MIFRIDYALVLRHDLIQTIYNIFEWYTHCTNAYTYKYIHIVLGSRTPFVVRQSHASSWAYNTWNMNHYRATTIVPFLHPSHRHHHHYHHHHLLLCTVFLCRSFMSRNKEEQVCYLTNIKNLKFSSIVGFKTVSPWTTTTTPNHCTKNIRAQAISL